MKNNEIQEREKKKISTLKHKTINDIIVKRNSMSITVSQYFQKKS